MVRSLILNALQDQKDTTDFNVFLMEFRCHLLVPSYNLVKTLDFYPEFYFYLRYYLIFLNEIFMTLSQLVLQPNCGLRILIKITVNEI